MKPTQDQIIAWAREADMNYLQHLSEESMKQVEHYTALVYEAGCKDENEACAEVCEGAYLSERTALFAAGLIRARREHG